MRHPLSSLPALVFLGPSARIRAMAVLQRWAGTHWRELQEPLGLTAAVDATTGCRRYDADGRPVTLRTALVHGLKSSLRQWSVTGEKSNEPTALRNHLSELLGQLPPLRLITGDALYAQRPLAEVLQSENCDYRVQIKPVRATFSTRSDPHGETPISGRRRPRRSK